MSTERETSYGGVVVRGDDVIVIDPARPAPGDRPAQGRADGRREPAGDRRPGGPRGDRHHGERCAIASAQVDYTYRRGGRRVDKTVHFYLCVFERGDTADHDHEVDDARWMPLEEARQRLSYPGEREMIERALSILAANG